MPGWFGSLGLEFVLLLFVSLVGYSARVAQEQFRAWWQRRTLGQFFGLPDATVTIVHGAIYDRERQALNYAAADPRSARAIASLFNRFHMREGKDFEIVSEADPREDQEGKEVEVLSNSDVSQYEGLWDRNVVLIGGPRRNPVLDSVLPHLTALPFEMKFDRTTRQTLLTDVHRHQQLKGSRDNPEHKNGGTYDYGLIASVPNPRNPMRRLVIVAGIHGIGTVGAAQFVAQVDNLKTLKRRAKNGVVAVPLLVRYKPGNENPVSYELC